MTNTLVSKQTKIELHCHLDGSLSTKFIRKFAPESMNIDNLSDEQLKELIVAPKNCHSLAEYLTRFNLPIACLQSYEAIEEAVLDVIKQAYSENVKYIEIRFAPTFSKNEGLSYRRILEAAVSGSKKGKEKYSVASNIIVCAMRHLSPETNLEMLREARELLGNGVCALDLAGDEAAFSNDNFTYLFEAANKLAMPMTIHSGECGNKTNISIAIEAGARRIGHGIAMKNDKALMDLCKEKMIGIELCPTSNFQTKAVSEKKNYPLRDFIDNGICATLNTDNRSVSDTTVNNEILFSLDALKLREGEIYNIMENAIHVSFADIDTKNELLKII